MIEILTNHQPSDNKALDAEPPIASFLKSMLIGGGPVTAAVTNLPTTHVPTRIPHASHAYPSCLFW